ncbi:AlpA family phage regulatory protein [Marinobacter nauticus]|uniref:AlpA family phage regulatory protein n=1 Tax=Marinobacter nauticus TaxID=2743 RepID=UPI001C99DA01|nr:AlpA family phage regulatory protein [Marinobacter nauticus]MBY5938924.1 AlpA family phage regulatory protein [Marinobacter nauticus]MBY5956153.1 AlpA family phage regulatory protein [Marinobacter nauticus]MBY6009944.1 AlpA family phage regulatory protein [Marinobacter nauticus]
MQILRLRDVIQKTGLRRSSIYKFSGHGLFPRPITLGGMSVGWTTKRIDQWIVERVRERDSVPDNAEHTTPWAVTIGKGNISQTDLQILRIKQVIELTGLARATVYKYIHEREFPLPVSLVGASVGWLRAEVEYWLVSCTGESCDESLNEYEASPEAA